MQSKLAIVGAAGLEPTMAAIEAGIKKAIIPAANMGDVTLERSKTKKIEIVPVRTIDEVLAHALTGDKKTGLIQKIKEYIPDFSIEVPRTPSPR